MLSGHVGLADDFAVLPREERGRFSGEVGSRKGGCCEFRPSESGRGRRRRPRRGRRPFRRRDGRQRGPAPHKFSRNNLFLQLGFGSWNSRFPRQAVKPARKLQKIAYFSRKNRSDLRRSYRGDQRHPNARSLLAFRGAVLGGFRAGSKVQRPLYGGAPSSGNAPVAVRVPRYPKSRTMATPKEVETSESKPAAPAKKPVAAAKSAPKPAAKANGQGVKPAPKAAKGFARPSGSASSAPRKNGCDRSRGKDGGVKRKLGLRGAAPWAARHAAKHAAEARARAAEPPLPGSARATIRVPVGADDIKAKIGDLHNALVQIKGFRKNLHKTFYDIGGILRDIQARRLYEAKGYGTFEAFLEREVDLGKTTSLRLIRVVALFLKEAALEYGM